MHHYLVLDIIETNGDGVFWSDRKLCFFMSKFQKIVSKFQKYREVEIVKKCFNENRNKEEHKKLNFK